MSEVQLAVYDLSRGMATLMSEQILGRRIDGIWHTGVVVFGIEYYFGGGIQKTPYGVFSGQNNLPVVQLLNIGNTSKTRSDLDTYLRSIQHLFSMHTYDLINNNCNNFSDNLCRFLTGTGIPAHIIDLPRTVFSSPGGAMLRPMIENMSRQMTGNEFTSTSSPDQFESVIQNNVLSAIDTVSHRQQQLQQLQQQQQQQQQQQEQQQRQSAAAALTEEESVKVLRLIDFVYTSSDTGNLNTIVEKIVGFSGGALLSDEEKTVMRQLSLVLLQNGDVLPTSACAVLKRAMEKEPSLQLSCLFLLRLVALSTLADEVLSEAVAAAVGYVIEKLVSSGGGSGGGATKGFVSGAVRSMAISVLVNFCSHERGQNFLLLSSPQRASEVVDISIAGLSSADLSVRLMSAALACNVALACTKADSAESSPMKAPWDPSSNADGELPSLAVQMLCSSLEGISAETNQAVRTRRLKLACNLLINCGTVAANLAKDLGFAEIIQDLAGDSKAVTPTTEEKLLMKSISERLA